MTARSVYTIGHGTRSTGELTSIIKGADVGRVIDVRRFPASRRHPHFAKDALERDLPESGITYEWRGEALGGRRRRSRQPSRHPALQNEGFRSYADHMDSPAFAAALEQLERDASQEPLLAIMCAETLWWRCHRRLIADALAVHGHEVIHLVDRNTRQRHKLHDRLRVDEVGRPVYDAGVTPPLGAFDRSR
jgi:uncharacterized protein (DUF488 family)